jgi:hypothetical protein
MILTALPVLVGRKQNTAAAVLRNLAEELRDSLSRIEGRQTVAGKLAVAQRPGDPGSLFCGAGIGEGWPWPWTPTPVLRS